VILKDEADLDLHAENLDHRRQSLSPFDSAAPGLHLPHKT